MFEQTAEVLEKRFGFRVEEYGLRQVFPRVPDHPLLAGLDAENLRDWRGEATLLPPRLKYEMRPQLRPRRSNGAAFPVTRVWRCGNCGNVASVLIEKPARGDFLPIVDGGFSLQYSPLMEYREGRGMVLFCQMDVTRPHGSRPGGRAPGPEHRRVRLAVEARPAAGRAVYAGEPAGKSHLEKAGVPVTSYEGGELSADQVLVVGPGGGQNLSAGRRAHLPDWLKAGGHLLAIGLDEKEARACCLQGHDEESGAHRRLLRAVRQRIRRWPASGPADVHNRDPREVSPWSRAGPDHRRRRAGHGREGQRRFLPTRALDVRL